MTREELLELIEAGENSGVEFKRDELRPEQLAREVAALANFQGGRVLLGVEDDGTITGIRRPGLERWVMDTVFGHMVHPLLLPFYEEVPVAPDRRVAVVTVTQGPVKPYVVRQRAARTSTCASAAPRGWPPGSSRRGCSPRAVCCTRRCCRFRAAALPISAGNAWQTTSPRSWENRASRRMKRGGTNACALWASWWNATPARPRARSPGCCCSGTVRAACCAMPAYAGCASRGGKRHTTRWMIR